jgi:hypothetical protein
MHTQDERGQQRNIMNSKATKLYHYDHDFAADIKILEILIF